MGSDGCGAGSAGLAGEAQVSELLYWYVRRPLGKLALAFVWALPRQLVYWCAIRVWASATSGPGSHDDPTGITFNDALKRWEKQ